MSTPMSTGNRSGMHASVAKARKYGQRCRIRATTAATRRPPTAAAASFARLRSGQQGDAEHAEPDRPGNEADEPRRPRRREVERDEACASDDGRNLGCDVHRGARTTTSARSTWPFASTRSA